MNPKSLNDKRYWLWRGKCQSCNETTDYTCEKKKSEGVGLTWEQFYKVVAEYYAPRKWMHCEHCDAYALMDVIAMSMKPPND